MCSLRAFFFGWSSFPVAVFDLIKESKVPVILAALDVHDRPLYAGGLMRVAARIRFCRGNVTFRYQLRRVSDLT
jgi:hypothetical protein